MSKRYFGLKNRRRWLPGWRVNRQFLGTVCGRGSGSCATVVRAGSRHSVLVTGFSACWPLRWREPGVLVGLGAVEQRYRAVLEVPGKAKTGWAGWRIGLRPAFCPHLMPALVEARIVAMRSGSYLTV